MQHVSEILNSKSVYFKAILDILDAAELVHVSRNVDDFLFLVVF